MCLGRKSNLRVVLLLLIFCFSNVGCSVFMAAKQETKKDLSVLEVGTDRSYLIGEFGAPEWSGEKDGKKVDIYKFVQGYSKGAKVGRAFFHGTADIFSLGLWEVIGTPTEMIADGKELKIEVTYDANNFVEDVRYLEASKKNNK